MNVWKVFEVVGVDHYKHFWVGTAKGTCGTESPGSVERKGSWLLVCHPGWSLPASSFVSMIHPQGTESLLQRVRFASSE